MTSDFCYEIKRINKNKKKKGYEPKNITFDSVAVDERELLLSEKRKKERALARLKSLYLYADADMPQTE